MIVAVPLSTERGVSTSDQEVSISDIISYWMATMLIQLDVFEMSWRIGTSAWSKIYNCRLLSLADKYSNDSRLPPPLLRPPFQSCQCLSHLILKIFSSLEWFVELLDKRIISMKSASHNFMYCFQSKSFMETT